MNKTTIAWTDSTWNPTRGCSRVSEGCRNCYAERVASRFSGPGMPYEGLARDGRWTGIVRLVEGKLDQPLRWQRPRRIFVNSMSDLFHESLPDDAIDRVFAVMALAPHVFQVLTKRPERMRAYMQHRMQHRRDQLYPVSKTCHVVPALLRAQLGYSIAVRRWPPPNVHLGVSVEDQETADARIPLLLQTPAAVRWVSAEPLLGPIDLNDSRDWMTPGLTKPRNAPRLDWVVVGGESGPGARPCGVAWIRDVVQQCREAGVPCFVKQLGANVRDRNDAEWDGSTLTAWPNEPDLEHDPDGYVTNHQGATVRVRLNDRKGGDPAEWPEDLRVQEWPSLRERGPK